MTLLEKAELVEIDELIICGQFKEAQRALESIKKSDLKLSINEKLQSRLLQSKILLYQGNYKKSYKIAEKVYNRFIKNNDFIHSLETICFIILNFNILDDIQEIKQWIEIGNEIYGNFDEEDNEKINSVKAHYLMVKGVYLIKIGDFEDARITLHQALTLLKESKNEALKAEILGNLAGLYCKQGNIDIAIENYQQSLDIWEAIENPIAIALVKNELASILALQGDIHLALAILQQELEIVMRYSDKMLIAGYQLNIGLINLEMNRFTQAEEWLELSLKNFKNIKNSKKISEVLYYLILTNIKSDNYKNANKNFDQLIKIENQIENIFVNQWFLLSKALILGENKRYLNLGKIEEIYSKILNEKEIDVKITSMALYNLSELQLNYLLKTKDEELLLQLERNLMKLIAYADIQDSYILYIETYLLQAQVAIISKDLQKAYDLLNQARSLAQIKELQRLADEVSNLYDIINAKIELWEKLYRNNASLIDLLELTPYEEGLKEIAQDRVTKKILDQSEDPILFIIQDPGGTSMFSKKFLPDSEFDEQLISAFLFAINNFMQETFEGKGSIERITYLDYTLLFKPMDPLLICYAFRGRSYTAQQKLDFFAENIEQSKSIWQSLISYTETGLVPDIDDLIILENLVDEIFNPIDTSITTDFDEDSIEDYLSDLLKSKL